MIGKTGVKDIDLFVRHFQMRANVFEIARKFMLVLIASIILGLIARRCGIIFQNDILAQKTIAILIAISWLGIAAFAILSFYRFKSISHSDAAKKIETASGLTELAPLSSKMAKISGGDKSLWDLSQSAKQEALDRIITPKLSSWFDKLLATCALLCLGAFLINPIQNLRSLRPDFSILIDGAPIEISAIATPPEYTKLGKIELSDKEAALELPEGTNITFSISGAKSAPKISYGKLLIKAQNDGANIWHANIQIDKSGKIKLHRFGVIKAWKIKVKKDHAPIIAKDFSLKASGYDSVDVAINAIDDYGIKRATLVLKSPNKPIETLIDIDPEQFNLGEVSNIKIKTSHSALVGTKVNAFIEIEDEKGQRARSKIVKIDLPHPVFNSDFAKALQEIRLLLLNETGAYRRVAQDYIWVKDNLSDEKIKIIASDNIKFAPANILRAYETLQAIHSIRSDLGLSIANHYGLTHALKTLEYAKSTKEAQAAADRLWNIIETYEQTKIDSRSKVSNAIENLKNALKNGAQPEEVEMLKSELKSAISEHLQALSEQSGESGDMEIAENEIAGEMDIEQILDGAETDAKTGNQNEALAKLDELNQLLSQMQPGGQGGQSVRINGINQSANNDPLAQEQQNLAEDTKNSGDGQNKSLIERQENLLSKIPEDSNSDTPTDNNLNEARAAMGAALEALKRGDNQSAFEAQEAAIAALNQRNNNQNPNENSETRNGDERNKDPLGRNIAPNDGSNPRNSQTSGGKNDGMQTKLPNKSDPIKAQSILNRLREKLSKPDQDEEERNYLENAIAN